MKIKTINLSATLFIALISLISCSSENNKVPAKNDNPAFSSKKNNFIPAGISVTTKNGVAELSWPEFPDATAYQLYWSTSAVTDIKTAEEVKLSSPFYRHENIINDVNYYYTYSVVINGVESLYSNEVTITALSPPVDAPTDVKIIPGDERLTLIWTASNNSNLPKTDLLYHVYWNTSGNVTKDDEKLVASASPAVHLGLNNGVQYYYRIAAVIDSLEGGLSNEVSSAPHTPTLFAPLNVVVTAGVSENLLEWQAVEFADSYSVYWNTSGEVGLSDQFFEVSEPVFTQKNLRNGNTYFYRVMAHNSSFNSSFSREVSARPATALPGTPQRISVVAGVEKATINWSAVENAILYNLYWYTNGAVTNVNPNVISPFNHNNLSSDLEVNYRISAVVNGVEGLPSAQVTVKPLPQPAAAPAGVVITNSQSQGVLLTWEPDESAIAYNLYWNTTGDVTTEDEVIKNVTSPYAHVDAENGKTYFYMITSVNNEGESLPSNVIKVTLAPNAPNDIRAEINENAIGLQWDEVSGAKNYHLYWSTSPDIAIKERNHIPTVNPGFTHIDLAYGQKYYYIITSENEAGESVGSQELVVKTDEKTIIPVAAPTDISVSVVANDIVLNWSEVLYATSYKMYLSPSPIISIDGLDGIPIEATEYVHQSPVVNQQYYYRISSIGSSGDSTVSEQVTAVIEDKLISDALKLIPDQTFRNCISSMASEHQWINASEVSYLECSSGEGGFIQSLDGIHQFLFVTEFTFFGGKIQNLDAFSGLSFPALTRIQLVNNGIENITGLGEIIAPNLSYLILDQNKISDLNPLSSLSSLIELSVSQNQVVDVSPASNLTALRKLDFHANKIGGVNIGNLNSLLPLTSSDTFEYFNVDQNIGVDCAELEMVLHSLGGIKIPDSPINDINCSVTESSLPLSPKNIVARAGADFVQFLWDESLGATSYTVYWSNEFIGSSSGSGAEVFEFPEVTHDFVHQQLQSGLPHYYQISASNANGESIQTSEISLTPLPVLLSEMTVPDPGFQECVNDIIDTGPWVYAHEVEVLNCSLSSNTSINDLTGIHLFSGVRSIDLSGKGLETLDGFDFSYFPDLVSLNLYGNSIYSAEALSTSIVPQLKDLDISSNNQLLSVKPLNSLTSLTSLKLVWNSLVDLREIPDLVNLEDLDISSMSFFSGISLNIDVLSNYSKLVELDMSFNVITDYSSLSDLTNLERLLLINNKIDDISFITIPSSVLELNLSNNEISDVTPLSGMTQLQFLNLNRNVIGNTPEENIIKLNALTSASEISLIGNRSMECNELIQLISDLEVGVVKFSDGSRVVPEQNLDCTIYNP